MSKYTPPQSHDDTIKIVTYNLNTMENNLEHLTEDRHFEIREKIQAYLIRNYYKLNDVEEVSNEQAYAWIKSQSKNFDNAFLNTVSEHPSFWNDAEKDFESAVDLVEQKMTKEENLK